MDSQDKKNWETAERILDKADKKKQEEQGIDKIKAHDVLSGNAKQGDILTKDDMTKEQKNWKISALKEHLGVLEEAMVWAVRDLDNFEQKLTINPRLRQDLENSVDNIGAEIEMVKRELRDLER